MRDAIRSRGRPYSTTVNLFCSHPHRPDERYQAVEIASFFCASLAVFNSSRALLASSSFSHDSWFLWGQQMEAENVDPKPNSLLGGKKDTSVPYQITFQLFPRVGDSLSHTGDDGLGFLKGFALRVPCCSQQ